MKRGIALIGAAAALLTGCHGPVEKARQKYEFLKENGGSLGEVCRAGRAMLDAQAEAQDPGRPEDRAIVDVDCLTKDIHGGDMPYNQSDPAYGVTADNMDAPL